MLVRKAMRYPSHIHKDIVQDQGALDGATDGACDGSESK